MSIELTPSQTRYLRGEAHGLKPLLQVGGKGLGEGLVAELAQLLEDHELVKVKVGAEDREARDGMIAKLASKVGAALVQRIGHTAVLYRPSKDKRRIVLPRA
ncbi:ribosome assembly RNA-binding protein YhbY [Lysobacter pythonis]|uniref:Ribosome assembly RNA-binding protein YhbY n=1 Tax=Solilutibacter pythonis TaxID=2483112 RepID=A0A3M2HF79_9GAMM|nr:ribosome assembly RNA-binding protein YhbY [Lysobacter pythonis]RMH88391.1 ribosome assembly RNA-binding protein YhbY [Lysobacter pythonis]